MRLSIGDDRRDRQNSGLTNPICPDLFAVWLADIPLFRRCYLAVPGAFTEQKITFYQ
jgi:hypothetical protein